jgi:hypothetical protein
MSSIYSNQVNLRAVSVWHLLVISLIKASIFVDLKL